MATDGRWVFDTGVVVSAMLLPRSTPRRAVARALQDGTMLVSASTVAELNEVLRRPRFDKYLREERRLAFLRRLIINAEVIDVATTVTECRDPKDNKFLELAVSGNATCIISGDRDLLVLHPFRGVPIVTPQDFLASSW